MLFAILVLTFIIEMRLIPDRRPIHSMCVVRQAHTTQHRSFCVCLLRYWVFFHSDHSDFGKIFSSAVQNMEYAGDIARLKFKLFCGMLCRAVPFIYSLCAACYWHTLFNIVYLYAALFRFALAKSEINYYLHIPPLLFFLYLFILFGSSTPKILFVFFWFVLVCCCCFYCCYRFVYVCWLWFFSTMCGWRASMRTKVI